jgi:signal transduction histidine kinase
MVPGIVQNDIEISEKYSDDLPHIYADPRLLRQVFINLITNSIKYSGHGGVITIETSLNNKDEIEVIVTDQGVGIPEDRIQDALEPFGQIHDPHTHSEIYQGTGLGLPLAKAMVEMHGGTFTLKSVENEGTTVVISFSKSRTRHH